MLAQSSSICCSEDLCFRGLSGRQCLPSLQAIFILLCCSFLTSHSRKYNLYLHSGVFFPLWFSLISASPSSEWQELECKDNYISLLVYWVLPSQRRRGRALPAYLNWWASKLSDRPCFRNNRSWGMAHEIDLWPARMHTLTHMLSHTHALSLTHTHTHTLTHTHTCSLSLSLSHTHTHTHTHTSFNTIFFMVI